MMQGGNIIIHVDPDIEELIPIFLEEMREYIGSAQEALDNSDHETIQRLGHTIKGTAGNFGFDAISDIGQSLERAAKALDSEGITRILKELSNCIEQVREALTLKP